MDSKMMVIAVWFILLSLSVGDYYWLRDTAISYTASALDLGHSNTQSSYSSTISLWFKVDSPPIDKAILKAFGPYIDHGVTLMISSDFTISVKGMPSLALTALPVLFTWKFLALTSIDMLMNLYVGEWGSSTLDARQLSSRIRLRSDTVFTVGGADFILGEVYDLRVGHTTYSSQDLTSMFTGTQCHSLCLDACYGPSHTACQAFIRLVDAYAETLLEDTEHVSIDKSDLLFRKQTIQGVQDLAVTGWVYADEIGAQVNWCSLVMLKICP
jgi:hypothetical protein